MRSMKFVRWVRRLFRGRRVRNISPEEREARERFMRTFPGQAVAQWALFDNLSAWMSGGFGTMVVVLVTAQSAVTEQFGGCNYAQLLGLAACGVMLGVIGKYAGSVAARFAYANEPVRLTASREILDGLSLSEEQRIEAVRGAIDEMVPWYLAWNARRGLRAAREDPFAALKMGSRAVSSQVICLWLQLAIAALMPLLVLVQQLIPVLCFPTTIPSH